MSGDGSTSTVSHHDKWSYRASVAATCMLALTLGGTCGAPLGSTQETEFEGPAVRLTLEHGSSNPPASVRVELWGESQTEPVARHEGALPLMISAPRGTPLTLIVEASGRSRHVARFTLRGDRTVRVPLPRGARIAGVVLDEESEPVEGASVSFRREGGPEVGWTARTDAEGRFSIDTLLDGVYRVEASSRGHAPTAQESVRAGEEQLRLVLERVGRVAGRVIRPDGFGAQGATVVIAGSGLWPARQVAAVAEGRFRFGDIPPGVYEVRAYQGDLVAEPRRGVTVEPGRPLFLTFALAAGLSLHGIVRDSETGRPIASAQVTVASEALDIAPRVATSDAQGRFAVRGLRPGGVRVSVFAEGYVPVSALDWEPGRTLELELEPAAILAGVVLDEHRRPIEGATIEVLGEGQDRQPVALSPASGFRSSVFAAQSAPLDTLPTDRMTLEVTSGPVPPIPLVAPSGEQAAFMPLPPTAEETRLRAAYITDEQGQFRVVGVPPGHVQVTARRAGRAPGATARIYVTPGSERDDLVIIMPPAGHLRGRVVDERNYGVEGVMVEVRSDREPYPQVTMTAARGEFELDDVFGELTVTAMPQGRPAARVSTTVESGQTARVELRLEGQLHTLNGRTVDERGYPISMVQLSVASLRADTPIQRTFFSAPDGTFSVGGLPAPPWRIEASAPNLAPARVDVGTVQREVRVVLAQGARVSGRVIDDYSGDPLFARVTIDRDELPPEALETRTDSDGQFAFARVRAGRWRLRIQTEDHIVLERTIDVVNRGHGPRDVELDAVRLSEAGWVEGNVTDALGSPVSRATVRVEEDETGPSASTDSQGHFMLRGLPAGNMVLAASHPAAGSGASHQVRVLAGRETLGINIRLSERFDPARAEALPGRTRGVAVLVTGAGRRVQVRQVIHGSRAERAGLRAGDLLAQIDGVAPESPSHAARMLRGAEGVPAILEVTRGEVTATLVVERETWIPP